jgi:multidrug resistance efflux pump
MSSPPRRGRLLTRLAVAVVMLAALAVGALFAYRWWWDSVHFVSTDNAQIAGSLILVGTLEPGGVSSVRYDIGDRVPRDAVVATLHVPMPMNVTGSGVPRMRFSETADSLVEVRSPVDGVVIARSANPGDTLAVGHTVLTLVEPQLLWVNANVEETEIRRVQVGQHASVHVAALDADLGGRVAAITPASAATFSLLPQQNASGNYTRVTQLQTVKIVLDRPEPRLAIGTSVDVKIRVAD